MRKHPFHNDAEKAVLDLIGFTEVPPQVTLDALEDLGALIEMQIDAIKEDMKNERSGHE